MVQRWRDLTTLSLVLAGAFVIPLVFVHDPVDSFRLPKELLFRAEAILLASVTLAAILLGASLPRPKWHDPWLLLPLIAFAIFVVLTMTSTKPSLSVSALGAAATTLVVFLGTVTAARKHGWIFIGVPLAAAAGNSLLVVAEETNFWMPFGVQSGTPHHLQCTALIGNPNEVGSYLGAAALACIAMLSARSQERRWSIQTASAAAVLAAGLIASRTLTAMVALAAAALTMLAIVSWKNAIRTAAVAMVAGVLVVALVTPLRQRATNMARWVGSGEYNALLTDRFTPFVAAWSMFVDHPLTGVGPGAFPWQYYDYKIRAEVRYPSLRRAYNRGVNYGEVHNDHLQVLAEEGLAGYCAFLALLGALAALSFRVPESSPDSRRRFVRGMALPLAVYWVVLSLAQFPLETTVVRSLLIHLAAVCVAWSDS